jgi:hypothetical protein
MSSVMSHPIGVVQSARRTGYRALDSDACCCVTYETAAGPPEAAYRHMASPRGPHEIRAERASIPTDGAGAAPGSATVLAGTWTEHSLL